MADEPDHVDGEWVTVAEAARRLGMSKAWFGAMAKQEGLRIARRGGRPGVCWPDVEAFIDRGGLPEARSCALGGRARTIYPAPLTTGRA